MCVCVCVCVCLCMFKNTFPYFIGEKTVNYTLVINPLPGSPLDSLPPEHSRVSIRINYDDRNEIMLFCTY